MSVSNEEFADLFADLVGRLVAGSITQELFDSELVSLLSDWTGLVPEQGVGPAVAAKVSAFVDLVAARDSDISAWAQGTADAVIVTPSGQPAPGWYPIAIQGGGTVWIPSPTKVTSETQKGDPGKTSTVFLLIGKPGASVSLGYYVAPGGQSFTNAKSRARCKIAPTAGAVFQILKNGVSVGTVTFTAGNVVGAVAFTGGTLVLVAGDTLEVTAPASVDATLNTPTASFAGD